MSCSLSDCRALQHEAVGKCSGWFIYNKSLHWVQLQLSVCVNSLLSPTDSRLTFTCWVQSAAVVFTTNTRMRSYFTWKQPNRIHETCCLLLNTGSVKHAGGLDCPLTNTLKVYVCSAAEAVSGWKQQMADLGNTLRWVVHTSSDHRSQRSLLKLEAKPGGSPEAKHIN